jgi:hypothetical protein
VTALVRKSQLPAARGLRVTVSVARSAVSVVSSVIVVHVRVAHAVSSAAKPVLRAKDVHPVSHGLRVNHVMPRLAKAKPVEKDLNAALSHAKGDHRGSGVMTAVVVAVTVADAAVSAVEEERAAEAVVSADGAESVSRGSRS